MSSGTPSTDLWLERSRLDGMLLGGVSYGLFAMLTIQATLALHERPRHPGQKIADKRGLLLAYIAITFILATIGFAANAKYTEMIWIDLRDTPGGPPFLITMEFNYWINRMALACYYVMEWFMEALLLHRCFVIWNYNWGVIVVMTLPFLGEIAMSILVLQESRKAIFYNINVEIAYLALSVGTNILYTVLVSLRLLTMRSQIRKALGHEHSHTYTSVTAMIIESAALYTVLGIIFIVAFAVHSNVSNLVFLSISHVQGVAQLLIILRVAQGRAFTADITSQVTATTLNFTAPDQRDSVQLPHLNFSLSSTGGLSDLKSTMRSSNTKHDALVRAESVERPPSRAAGTSEGV